MYKRIFILFFLLFVFCGCAAPVIRTELDHLYEKNFDGFGVPEIIDIKKGGENKGFPYTTFDEVWDSAIIVLMQRGIIVNSSKDSGIITVITTPPISIFVERGEVITIYLKWMDNLYRRSDKPGLATDKFDSYDKTKMANAFFDKLSTQVYAKEKWKYLY